MTTKECIFSILAEGTQHCPGEIWNIKLNYFVSFNSWISLFCSSNAQPWIFTKIIISYANPGVKNLPRPRTEPWSSNPQPDALAICYDNQLGCIVVNKAVQNFIVFFLYFILWIVTIPIFILVDRIDTSQTGAIIFISFSAELELTFFMKTNNQVQS